MLVARKNYVILLMGVLSSVLMGQAEHKPMALVSSENGSVHNAGGYGAFSFLSSLWTRISGNPQALQSTMVAHKNEAEIISSKIYQILPQELWRIATSYLSMNHIAPTLALKTLCLSKPTALHSQGVATSSVQFDTTGKRVLTVAGSQAWLFDSNDSKAEEEARHRFPACHFAYFSGVQNQVVADSSMASQITIFDADSGAERMRLPHDGPVFPRQCNPDDTLVIVCEKGKPKLCDMKSGKELKPLEVGKRVKISNVQFSADGTKVAGEDSDDSAHIWDSASGKLIKKVIIASGGFADAGRRKPMFNNNATKLVAFDTGGIFKLKGVVRIIDIASEVIDTIEVEEPLRFASFNHDGTRIIGISNGKAMVWDAQTKVLLHTIATGNVTAIDFNADDTAMIVAGGYLGSVYTHLYRSTAAFDLLFKNGITLQQMILLRLLEQKRSKQEKTDWTSLALNYDTILNSFDDAARAQIIKAYSIENVTKK